MNYFIDNNYNNEILCKEIFQKKLIGVWNDILNEKWIKYFINEINISLGYQIDTNPIPETFIRDNILLCSLFYTALFNIKYNLNDFIQKYTEKQGGDMNPLKKLFIDYGRGYFTYTHAILASKDNGVKENMKNYKLDFISSILGDMKSGFLCYPFILLERKRARVPIGESGMTQRKTVGATKKTYDYGKYIEMFYYYDCYITGQNPVDVSYLESFKNQILNYTGIQDQEMLKKLYKKIDNMIKAAQNEESRERMEQFFRSIQENRIGKSAKAPSLSRSPSAIKFFNTLKENTKKKEREKRRKFTKTQKRWIKYLATKHLENIYFSNDNGLTKIENGEKESPTKDAKEIINETINEMGITTGTLKGWQVAYLDFDELGKQIDGQVRYKIGNDGGIRNEISRAKRDGKKEKVVKYNILGDYMGDVVETIEKQKGMKYLSEDEKMQKYINARDPLLDYYYNPNEMDESRDKDEKIKDIYNKKYRNDEYDLSIRYNNHQYDTKARKDIDKKWKELVYYYNSIGQFKGTPLSEKGPEMGKIKRYHMSYEPETLIALKETRPVIAKQPIVQTEVTGGFKVTDTNLSKFINGLEKNTSKQVLESRNKAYQEIGNDTGEVNALLSIENNIYKALYNEKSDIDDKLSKLFNQIQTKITNVKGATPNNIIVIIAETDFMKIDSQYRDKFFNEKKNKEMVNEYFKQLVNNVIFNKDIWDKYVLTDKFDESLDQDYQGGGFKKTYSDINEILSQKQRTYYYSYY